MFTNNVFVSIWPLLLVALSVCQVALAASRTTPPSGGIVVRAGTTASGEFKTLTAALQSLPDDSSSRSRFIYPGEYNEQIHITRSGPLTVCCCRHPFRVISNAMYEDLWLHDRY
jgi:pectin methylesterase-like acyl-CoA thioesterase